MTAANPTDLFAPQNGYVRMMLRDIRTEARLGIHPWERHPEKPQRLLVNVELFAADTKPDHSRGVSSIVDYDYIRDALLAWPSRPQINLIEELLEELAGLCFRDPRVLACKVSVVKPDIYNEAGGAGVELYRLRANHPGA